MTDGFPHEVSSAFFKAFLPCLIGLVRGEHDHVRELDTVSCQVGAVLLEFGLNSFDHVNTFHQRHHLVQQDQPIRLFSLERGLNCLESQLAIVNNRDLVPGEIKLVKESVLDGNDVIVHVISDENPGVFLGPKWLLCFLS